jgi:hypothetical protein
MEHLLLERIGELVKIRLFTSWTVEGWERPRRIKLIAMIFCLPDDNMLKRSILPFNVYSL